jgi:hypothetical protein
VQTQTQPRIRETAFIVGSNFGFESSSGLLVQPLLHLGFRLRVRVTAAHFRKIPQHSPALFHKNQQFSSISTTLASP